MALIRSHKQGWAIALSAIGLLALAFVPSLGMLPYLLDQSVQRFALFGIVAAFVAFLGGARSLALGHRNLARAIREGFCLVGVSLVLCGIDMLSVLQLVREGVGPSPAWFLDLLQTALLCVSVGLYEEALFRVLLLGGMLSRHGWTRSGMAASLLVSSVAFGVAHVTGTASLDPLSLVQMLLKTAQTGCIGLVLGVVYLRTRSFAGIVALHALADFFLMMPTVIGSGADGLLGSYVSQGDDPLAVVLAVSMIATYLLVIALYAPATVRTWRLFEELPAPEPGPLSEGWLQCWYDGRPFVEVRRPVRPTGL